MGKAPHRPPDTKLPQVDLSAFTLDHWMSEAEDIVRAIVSNRQSWFFRFQDYQHLYKPIYAKLNTHGCVRVIKPAKTIEYMSRGELNMTLNELAYGLHCETNPEQRAVYAQLYQTACVDGALLKLFKGRSPADPFHSVAVKWIALRSHLNKIRRDFVYFEYCFTVVDADGRKVLVEFKKSKKFRQDQLRNHDLDATRGSMYLLNLYYMESDRVVMHSLGRYAVSGTLSAWSAASMMPMMFERVNNHHGLVYTRTLADAGMTAHSLADRRTGGSTACRVCSKKFTLMRGKKWCRGCGHAVCRDCVADVIMYTNEIASASRLIFTRQKFCRLCLFHMREHFYHESVVYQPSHQLSLELEEGNNTLQQSRITAAMDKIDDLFERHARCSINAVLCGGFRGRTTILY